MLSLEEAQQRILSTVRPLPPADLPLAQSAGRFLATSVSSPINLPPFDNSAMDGYAVIAADIASASETTPTPLRLIGKTAAGAVFQGEVTPGTCVRLFTGSPLPSGADAVVIQEDTTVDPAHPELIHVRDRARPWENVRLKGEDVKSGSAIAQIGDRLTFGRLSLLAATGFANAHVHRAPTVALIATGSELREGGQDLQPWQIFESNRIGLSALVAAAGATANIHAIVPDSLEATERALGTALESSDLVITSGGVSVGEFDHVKQAFENLGGTLDFWRVAIRPGKPFVFGQCQNKCLFGLPGNPVSAMVTFLLLARPALLKMQGAREFGLRSQPGLLTTEIINRGDRRHFVRVTLQDDGTVVSAVLQGSHALSSLATANGMIDTPPKSGFHPGETVQVLRWD